MKILGIDTSSMAASVAVIDDNKLICEYTINTKKTHSQKLMPMIENMLGCTADVKKDDWSLASSIERNFGDVVPKSVREVRNAVEAAGGKDD